MLTMGETLLRMAVMDQPIKLDHPFLSHPLVWYVSDTKQHPLRRGEVRLPRIPDKFLSSLAYSFEWFLKNWPFCWGIFQNSRMSYWSMPVESLWTPFPPPPTALQVYISFGPEKTIWYYFSSALEYSVPILMNYNLSEAKKYQCIFEIRY